MQGGPILAKVGHIGPQMGQIRAFILLFLFRSLYLYFKVNVRGQIKGHKFNNTVRK